MNKFHVSLLAVLFVSVGLNAGEVHALRDANKAYNLIVRDPRSGAALAHYASTKVSIVDQLPEYVKNTPLSCVTLIKKRNVDRAFMHVVSNVVKKAVLHDDKRSTNAVAIDSAKDAGISLALSAIWNAADRLGVACYVKLKSDEANAIAYGLIHGACRVALDANTPLGNFGTDANQA